MFIEFLFVLVGLTGIYFLPVLVSTLFNRKRRHGEPEVVGGRLAAIEFSRHAVDFLHRVRRHHGDVFTIKLVNQYMTFVMDPHSVHLVAKERNFDFNHIQKQVNLNVFNHTVFDAAALVRETNISVRGQPLYQTINVFIIRLNDACIRLAAGDVHWTTDCLQSIGCSNWKTDGLRRLAAKTALDAILNTLFGHVDGHLFDTQTVYENLEVFHRYFNYLWLGFPISLFPPASVAFSRLLSKCPDSAELLSRNDLSLYVRRAIEMMLSAGQSDSDIKGHNLVYLHVNYNIFQLAFWALYHMTDSDVAMTAVVSEIKELVESRQRPGTEEIHVTVDDINQLKILDSVVRETVRLSSGVFMVRHVAEDTQFTTDSGHTFNIRQGDKIAVYPPAIHMDPDIFHNPTLFKFDRFVDAKFYSAGRPIKDPLLAFGTLCPGKQLALIQLKVFLISFITRFELRFDPMSHGRAEYDKRYYGHEVLPPVNDVIIQYRPKERFPVFVLSHE